MIEDDSNEQRKELINEVQPRPTKARGEYLLRRTEKVLKVIVPRKESSDTLTKIMTTSTMGAIAVVFVAVCCFYAYVPLY
jgi:hypothetical protein